MLQSSVKIAVIVLFFEIVWMGTPPSKGNRHTCSRKNCTVTHGGKAELNNLTHHAFTDDDFNCCLFITVQDLRIHFIQKGLFSKFVKLKRLSLHNLPLQGEAVKNSLMHSGKNKLKLTHLSLQNVGLNNELLKSLIPYLPEKLTELDLKKNTITVFSTNFISNTTVKYLNLSQNQNITIMLEKGAPSLEHLDLAHSNFEWKTSPGIMPMCKIPNLITLNFEGNRLNLSTFDNDMNCFGNLTSLCLSLCDIIDPMTKESFSFFPRLKSLYLNGISIKGLFPSFQNITYLTELSLNDVEYSFKSTLENVNIFRNLHNLRRLKMQNWKLHLLNESELTTLFSPLVKTLEHLDLKLTGLSTIPSVVREMDNLRKLTLSNNSISSWESISENSNKNLRSLFMEWNLIETVNPHFIPERVIDFRLEGNPFLCTCELMPYKNWVKEKKLGEIIKDWTTKYHCFKPRQWTGHTLDTFSPKKTDCQDFNAYVITAIALCCLMVIIVIGTNVYIRRREKNLLKKYNYYHDSRERQKLLSSS